MMRIAGEKLRRLSRILTCSDAPPCFQAITQSNAVKAFSTAGASSSMSMADFQAQGLVDGHGLTMFNTLHELQLTACKVYPNNELFGTFSEKSGHFEYLTYRDFGEKVDECRAVLKHLGQ
jgi:hypothetical protein